MTIPRITSVLIILALGRDALALQLGQISGQSRRGQPLAARITLYGVPPIQRDALAVEIRAEFGAPADTLARLGVQATLASDDSGASYIAISSSAAVDEEQLALRVRLKEGSTALVRRYTLTPAARPAPRAAPIVPDSWPASITAPVATATNNHYGPVRPGQSLWRILQEIGLARSANGPLMRAIVVANPAAFVGGDPTRLRAGAMLRLPDAAAIGTAAQATIALPTAHANDNAQLAVADPALAARLARLAKRFALIRARYAEQKGQPTSPPDISKQVDVPRHDKPSALLIARTPANTPVPVGEPTSAANAPGLPAPITVNKTKPASQPVSATVAHGPAARGDYAAGERLLLLGGGTLGLALVMLVMRLGRRLRNRRADAGVRSADRNLVAEIARKTEKRVQLEGEVKRMIAGRRAAAESPMSSGLRPVDLLAGIHPSMEDIETQIAHGQYDKAANMLEQIIAAGPHNHRAKLRLAEIYYLNERREEFVELIEDIHRRHRSDIDDDNWARLMRMGKIIAPGRPPFSGPTALDIERQVG